MVDFTNCEINNYKYYGGKNGGKICIVYQNQDYMLKFPGVKSNSSGNIYSNSCISEHIACRILKTLGFNVQETILGTYKINGKEKVAVACLDFTSPGTVLKQFAELKNSQIDSSEGGYGTELSEILETIDNQTIYGQNKLREFFFDLFIADSLVGNFDRHNGNWGFLVNETLREVKIAPIYDCASCLYPQPTDDDLAKILNDNEELLARVYVFPTSAIKINNKKINYYDFINSLENDDCNKALLRIFPRIDLNKINQIIDEIEIISDIRKKFYKKIIKLRYEKILKYSYDKLTNS